MHERCRLPALCLLLASAGLSQETGAKITVDWIYGPGPAMVAALPQHAWCADGSAILMDPIAPAPTFMRLDPVSGEQTAVLDAKDALSSLDRLTGSAPPRLRWPDSFDRAGKHALYSIDGDLFVLDLLEASFRRLTETAQTEKSAEFSPDGTKVAFVRDNDLYAVDVDEGTELRLTSDGSETVLNGTLSWVYWEELFGRRDIGYWWSPDSRAIAYLQTDESAVDEVHFVDFQPAVPRVLEQRYPKAGSTNPSVRVGLVELDAAKTSWVGLDQEGFEYIARVKWLPGGAQVSVQTMSRDQQRLDLYFVERTSGMVARVLTETDDGWINIHDDLWFLRDGHFVWQSERDGFAHLYLYRMDGELVRQITAGDWAVRASSGGVFWLRQAVCAIDEERGWIYFTALEKSSVEKHLYRIGLDGKDMQRLSEEQGTHSISFSPDARYYLDSYSNIRTPPALRLHRADGKLVTEITAARTALTADLGMVYPELTTVPARDGFAMPAQILKPADFDAEKRYPVIFHVYSGPSAPTVSDSWQSANYFDQILARAGYLVVKLDNRSSTAISKTLENTTLHQLGSDSELDDLVDGIKWIKRQPFVDPERAGIWGWSGGGSTTLLVMTRSREIRAGIAVAPVTDWRYYDTKWAEAANKRPEDNPRGYAHTSLVARAKNLHGRLLLVHGTHDDNVHPQNSWHFIDELVAAHKPFDMMFYPMRKHGIADRDARIHLYQKMVEFWKLWL